MKALMMVTYPEMGGTETHVLYLCLELMRQGIEVGLVTAGGPFVPFFIQEGITVHQMHKFDSNRPEKSALEIKSIIRTYKYDIFHVHDSESLDILALLHKRCPDIGLVLTVHGEYIFSHGFSRFQSYCDKVIVVSPALLKQVEMKGVQSNKLSIVTNGIDTTRFYPARKERFYRAALGLPLNGFLVLYAGRFQSDKLEIAKKCIQSAKRLGQDGYELTMVLVGFGKYHKRLLHEADMVNEKLQKEFVFVHEATMEIDAYYHAATCVIGTGRVALEAMSCGKPVVAVGCAGYDGIVTEQKLPNLLIHNFGDHDAGSRLTTSRIVDSIKKLSEHPNYRKHLGEVGRKAVLKQFSIEHAGTLIRDIYLDILTSKSTSFVNLEVKGGL